MKTSRAKRDPNRDVTPQASSDGHENGDLHCSLRQRFALTYAYESNVS